MATLTAADVKYAAKEMGADLVGIGSMDRWEGAPPNMDPRYIFPDAKSLIGLAFRIPRGYLRGIEEGTQFYQYPSMGYANINEVYAPMVLHELACLLEDRGYEGCVFRNTGARMTSSDMSSTEPDTADEGRRLKFSEPVEEGKPAPDVMFHFRIAAFICGLGEIGWSKVFLTPEFGPRQRFAFMLTDAPLEPDPIYDGPPLCERCMSCVRECPVGAISRTESVKITVAGREVEWGALSEWNCFHGYMGSSKETNPFIPLDAFDELPNGRAILEGKADLSAADTLKVQAILRRYYPNSSGYNSAVCGGRGCLRACMCHLEDRDRLTRKFESPFRKQKPWRLGVGD